MNRTVRFAIGALGMLAVLVALALLYSLTRGGSDGDDPPMATVACIGGSEKSGLMADPDVREILEKKYALRVDFSAMGSIDQALLTTDELRQRGVECLWPSSAAAQIVFEAQHALSDFPGYRAETVLNTPEVIYSGPEATDALVALGIVQIRDGRYFIVGMQELLQEQVLKDATWQGAGAPTLRGPIIIESTNPAQSNSGFTSFLLQLGIIATNDPYRAPSAEQARVAMPTIRALYDAQGLQSRSSGFGFDQWLLEGGELSSPLYAGYESSIIEKVVEFPDQADQLLGEVRLLYPEPTVYNAHPILALSDEGRRLIDALKDPQIQQIAWERYGFRSVQLGVTDVADFPQLPLAAEVQTTNLPNAEVILLLLDCVRNNVCTS